MLNGMKFNAENGWSRFDFCVSRTCHFSVVTHCRAYGPILAVQELESNRPLLPPNWQYDGEPLNFPPTVVDTLETFRLAAQLEDGSLGAYVISQCQQTSDILAVLLLQQDAG